MKCLVCGKQFDGEGAESCPRCAFPIIGMTEETEENLKWASAQADAYAQQLLLTCSIGIRVYAYASYADGTMHFREEREFPLAAGADLKRGRIYWNDQEFAVNRKLDLEVLFHRKKGMNIVERHLNIQIKPPQIPAPWKAGVLVNPDFSAAIVVGDSLHYSSSPVFDLLR